MLSLQQLRGIYSVELRNLVDAIADIDRRNEPLTFDQLARLKTLAISENIARQRLSEAIAEKIGCTRPVSLIQYLNSAAIDASYGVHA